MRVSVSTYAVRSILITSLRYGDARDLAHQVCEPAVASKLGDMWGVDKEGELRGVWRDSGHPQLFFGMGKRVVTTVISEWTASI